MPQHAPVFGWSTPAANWDGSTPAPWRVAYKATLEARLAAAGYPHAVAYVDYETVGGKQALYIGLRDNRDLSKHAANLERLGDVLEGWKLGKVKRVKRAGRLDYLLLIDAGEKAKAKKNPIRGAGVNARGGWQHAKGSGVWLAKYASGPSYQIVRWNQGTGSDPHPFYQLDSGRWSTKADSFKCAAFVGNYPTLSQAQQVASSARSMWRRDHIKSNPRKMNPTALRPVNKPGSHREGTVHLPLAKIARAIGFAPNVKHDPIKVEASWGFRDAQGREGFVWCYREPARTCREWSCSGSRELLHDMFGAALHWDYDNPKKRAAPKRKKNPDYDIDTAKVHITTLPHRKAQIVVEGFNDIGLAREMMKQTFVRLTGKPPKGVVTVTYPAGGFFDPPRFSWPLAQRIVEHLIAHKDGSVQGEKS